MTGIIAPSAGFWPEQATVEEAEYLVEQWIPEKSTIFLYGRHGSLKSFLIVHAALCGALGRHLMGNAIHDAFGTVICCGEKKARFGKRIVAWNKEYDVTEGAGVFTREGCPDLTDEDAVSAFIEEINAMKPDFDRRGAPLKLIALDTLSRALRSGNVSDPTTAQQAINSIQRIVDGTGCTVLCSAHVAKATGSDTIKGAGEFGDSADAYIYVERDRETKVVTATLGKQSDGPDGLKFGFRFQPVVVGQGRRGDITSGTIEAAEIPESSGTKRGPTTLSPEAMLIDTAITRLIDEERTVPIPSVPGAPAQGRAVRMSVLRAKAYDLGLRAGEEPDNPSEQEAMRKWEATRKKAFDRALGQLFKAGRVRREHRCIWPL
jgi:hypothetical protein